MEGIKGYTVEVIKRDENGYGVSSKQYNYKTEEEARSEMTGIFKNMFCILTEWAQFDGGFGDYEIEIARQNW